jgi:hypothetical protein
MYITGIIHNRVTLLLHSLASESRLAEAQTGPAHCLVVLPVKRRRSWVFNALQVRDGLVAKAAHLVHVRVIEPHVA